MQVSGIAEFLSILVVALVIVIFILIYLFWKQKSENRKIMYPMWVFRKEMNVDSEKSLIESDSGEDISAEYLRNFDKLQKENFNDSLLLGAKYLYDLEWRFRRIYEDFRDTVKERLQSVVDDNKRLRNSNSDLNEEIMMKQEQNSNLRSEKELLASEKARIESRYQTEIANYDSQISDIDKQTKELSRYLTEIKTYSEREWSNIAGYFADQQKESVPNLFDWRIRTTEAELSPSDKLRTINSDAERILNTLKAIPDMTTESKRPISQELIEKKETLDFKIEDFERRQRMKRGTKIIPSHYYRILEEILKKVETYDEHDEDIRHLLYDLGIFTLDRLIENFTESALSDYV